MAETSIEWTSRRRQDGTVIPGYTFNPWRGCSRVSAGCDHCYAETMSKRNPAVLGTWGEDGVRVIASEPYWRAPLKWNAAAERSGERARVFCASLADWLEDRRDLDAPRHRLVDLIEITPALDWMLLTKRPENFDQLAPGCWVTRSCPAHVQLGVTAEDQPNWDRRVRILQRLPARTRFVSAEPLLGSVVCGDMTGVHQVICGGESGPGARPMHPAWARALRDECTIAGVAFFFKQWGAWSPVTPLYEGRDDSAEDGTGELEQVDTRGVIWGERDGQPNDPNTWLMERVGKKAAGRLLDGREWNECPELR